MHRVRTVLALVAAVAIALLASGCGGGNDSSVGSEAAAKKGGTLSVALRGEVETLDPLKALNISDAHVLYQIVEPLFKTNEAGEVEPLLVTDAKQSSDHLTWTFELRKGLEFSTGDPVSADDVVFSLDQVRKSVNWSGMFEPIASVEATSPTTVVVKTKAPDPGLLSQLSLFAAGIIPKDFGGVSEEEFAQHPIGTGPFQLVKWTHGQSISLERNPYYWQQGRPYLDRLLFQVTPADNSRAQQIVGGQVDVAEAPPFTQLTQLEQNPELNVGRYPFGACDFLFLNSASPVFADPRAREAANLAIDRAGIVKVAYSDFAKPAGSWLPPALEYSDQSIEVERDVAKAKKLLAEAVADGIDPSFKLMTIAEDSSARTASQVMQQDLEGVGFEVEIEALDASAFYERAEQGEFDVGLSGVYSDIVDPTELVSYYVVTNGLFANAEMGRATKLSEAAATEPDSDKRRQLYEEFQDLMAREQLILTIDYQPFVWATRDNVVGLEISATGLPDLVDAGFAG